jgi:hypothetical protein
MNLDEVYPDTPLAAYNDELVRLSHLLDEAQKELDHWTREYAVTENNYRKRKAQVYLATEGTIEYRKMTVDNNSEHERVAAHLAEGLKVAALENVRNRRAQLNACQTRCNNIKTEMELSRGPQPAWSHQ